MTPEEVDALGVSTDLRTAARALNISGSAAYKLAADGEFPLPTFRFGTRIVVATAELKALLGLDKPLADPQLTALLERTNHLLEQLLAVQKLQAIDRIA